MFTVIIPTIWKANTFEKQLIELCNCKFIDEIILINNNKDNTPNIDILNNIKILHIKPDKNLIVNPSWNIGVKLSKNNNICLLNDDILFDINLFEFMLKHKDKTLCGISMDNCEGEFRLVEANTRTHCFGCMMFLRKDSYNIIPDNLLLLYGDDYLFHKNIKNGNKNYYIYGCKNNKVFGVSSCTTSFEEKYMKIISLEKNSFEESLIK